LTEERGFPRDRLSAAGYADTRPVTDGTDAASLAMNRRVEIVVLTTAVSG
jgi:chemotaxis protein MotB